MFDNSENIHHFISERDRDYLREIDLGLEYPDPDTHPDEFESWVTKLKELADKHYKKL